MLRSLKKFLGLNETIRGKVAGRVRKQDRLQLEELNTRILPSASPIALTGGGQLMIHGTKAADTVTVSIDVVDPSKLDVVFNGVTKQFKLAQVKSIRIDGGAGNDLFTNNTALPSFVDGGQGDDQLTGGSGKDNMQGGAGKDMIRGRGGNDLLHGGLGNDLMDGGQGNDDVEGDAGNDDVRGGLGDDRCVGGAGNDHLHGGLGDDSLDGGAGSDDVSGDGGSDRDTNGEHVNTDVHLEAPLTGANGAVGKAEINQTTGGFEVSISGAAAKMSFDVLIDGTEVGTITTNALGRGELELSTLPVTVTATSTVTVGDPAAGGLSGSFQNAAEAEFKAVLRSSSSSVRGEAKFDAAELDFRVEIQGAAPNTIYDVAVNGTVVAQITTDAKGEGKDRIANPSVTITEGTPITVGDPAAPLLQGVFAKDDASDD